MTFGVLVAGVHRASLSAGVQPSTPAFCGPTGTGTALLPMASSGDKRSNGLLEMGSDHNSAHFTLSDVMAAFAFEGVGGDGICS